MLIRKTARETFKLAHQKNNHCSMTSTASLIKSQKEKVSEQPRHWRNSQLRIRARKRMTSWAAKNIGDDKTVILKPNKSSQTKERSDQEMGAKK